jgi:hypothetical protein
MIDQDRTAHAISKMNIQVQVCPRGHVYLYVGHTCLFLRQDEFLDVAQIVHAVENHLRENSGAVPNEQSH